MNDPTYWSPFVYAVVDRYQKSDVMMILIGGFKHKHVDSMKYCYSISGIVKENVLLTFYKSICKEDLNLMLISISSHERISAQSYKLTT